LAGAIERIRNSVAAGAAGDYSAVKIAVEAAIALILEEHQDWNLLVRPHRLPLA
jgi:microcompartment protein CcmL/EutN